MAAPENALSLESAARLLAAFGWPHGAEAYGVLRAELMNVMIPGDGRLCIGKLWTARFRRGNQGGLDGTQYSLNLESS